MKKYQCHLVGGTMLFLLFLLFFSFIIKAEKPSIVKTRQVLNGPTWSFKENKGQLNWSEQQVGSANSKIKYYGTNGNVSIYCKAGKISFVFATLQALNGEVSEATGKISKPGLNSPQLITQRADLTLLGSNLNAEITATNQQEYYENYYTTGDANHGITHVHTYKTITYEGIYPHIDLVLDVKELGLEYSFIVHPGGNTDDIQIQWGGLENVKQMKKRRYGI